MQFKNILKINIFYFFSFKFTEKNEQNIEFPYTPSPLPIYSFLLLMSYISVMHLLQLMS